MAALQGEFSASATGFAPSPIARLQVSGQRRASVSTSVFFPPESDMDVDDDLARAQKQLKDLKAKISAQSKKNFVLERDVRFLDSRIALLLKHQRPLDVEMENYSQDKESESSEAIFPDDRRRQHYGNLFFLLQTEPRHIAKLCRIISLAEMDSLLQCIMFTLYGNQYESREEHLLLSMFQMVLTAQFEASTDFGSLMRQNSPVSRMVTTYTRRGPGQSYLKEVLSPLIASVIEAKNLNLEINPLSVYEQIIEDQEMTNGSSSLSKGVSQDVAAANADVQAIINPRLMHLMAIANNFLDKIVESLDTVPYGIRWICKQIRMLTKRKYPDATDFSICSLIGGFFFLRFVNPAIVTPSSYMLVDAKPSKNPNRTLTLIAKMIQNLANKPTYSKETYMLALNPFVEENRERITKFLNDLCEVGDFYETLEMDQYLALSKKDLSLNITLNEIYSTHALLFQHMDELVPEPNGRLRVVLNDLGPAPPIVPRKDNKSMNLPLFSRWEAPLNESPIAPDGINTPMDLLYIETKNQILNLVRSHLGHLANQPTLMVNQVLEAVSAKKEKDPMLLKRAIGIYSNLSSLEKAHLVNSKDNYSTLSEEIRQELARLKTLRERMDSELGSLEAVYKTICDHNNYLQGQLKEYKAYLNNVRLRSVQVGKTKNATAQGPIKFTYTQLEREGIITESQVPSNRRNNVYFNITCPVPGTFIIALHYKGRDKAILEIDTKLDDLLEKQQENVQNLDIEYVHLNVTKTLNLIYRCFYK